MNRIIAITVSTNYDDLLQIIIPQNYKFFYKWYIITHKNDNKTIDVIKNFNFDNIIILYYDFYANGATFNKGGAIKYCQEKIIPNLEYKENILLLDSDIFLPNNFLKIINNIEIKNDILYGTYKRLDYYSYYNLRNNIVDFYYPWSNHFLGYFQLYKYNETFLYDDSEDCRICDFHFQKNFKNGITIPRLVVAHLGKDNKHFLGRKNKDDFMLDTPKKQLQYKVKQKKYPAQMFKLNNFINN